MLSLFRQGGCHRMRTHSSILMWLAHATAKGSTRIGPAVIAAGGFIDALVGHHAAYVRRMKPDLINSLGKLTLSSC
jgi:hypothetical protein